MRVKYDTKKEDVLKLAEPCKCEKCEHPCNFGSGAFIDGEIEKLAEFLGISKKEVKENYLEKIEKFNTTLWRPKIERKDDLPFGKCTFFDKENGCTIHEVKPTECRIAMGCKDYGEDIIIWFMMNHYFNPKDPESIRQYKLYVESGGKILEGAELEKFLKKLPKDYGDLKQDKDWEKILGLKDTKRG
ncbi:MAG: YkgJ family cysteine cluster protein [Nanoarchaeota archaeon]